jgi:hypothetical protein
MPALTKRSPCPCGSGKKYKHCHWDADHPQGDAPLEPAVTSEESHEVQEGPPARWPLAVFALIVVGLAVGFGWKTGSVGQGITVGIAGLLALGIFAVARDAPPPAPKPKTKYQRSGIAPLPPPEERRIQ